MGGRRYNPVDLLDVVSSPSKYVGQHISVDGIVSFQPEGAFLFPDPDSKGILLTGLENTLSGETPVDSRYIADGRYIVQGDLNLVEDPQWVIDETPTSFGSTVHTPNVGSTLDMIRNYYLKVDKIQRLQD